MGAMHILRETGRTGASDGAGLQLAAAGDGAWRVEAERLELRALRFEHPGLEVHVARAQFERLSATLRSPADGTAPQLVQADVGAMQLLGVEARLTGAPRVDPAALGPWRLEALAGMRGALHAFISDAIWVLDVEVRLAIERGCIDFNRTTVAHLGPDSHMGISRGGIHVDAPRLGRKYLYLFTAREIPGAQFETRGAGRSRGVTDRGRLDLHAFVEGLLSHQPFALPGRMANRQLEATLDRTRLTGELVLGDGRLGTQDHHLVLAGQAQGRNRVIVSAAVLSHELVLRLPELAAERACTAWQGLPVRSGPVSADLSLRVGGLGLGPRPDVTLGLGSLRLQDVHVGTD